MGYWTTNTRGDSFATTPDGVTEMLWGDQPADAMDSALESIVKMFEASFQRKPTHAEIRAGVEFSIDAAVGEGLVKTKTTPKFPIGTRVRKTKGSSWQGHVVGHYSSSLTPDGVNVESEREPGSVQIYPVTALEVVE